MASVAAKPFADVRADFPVLEREINGHPLVYLDSAATAQKPRRVIETMERFYSYSYGTVHRGVIEAVRYAKSLAPERLIAVSVVTNAEEQDRLSKAWTDFGMPIELHTIASPYRELTQPVLEYLDELDAESPDDVITVVIPEYVTGWKQQWLQTSRPWR